MFDVFKKKTVEEIVTTAKETVTSAVNDGMEEKIKGVAMLLPVFVAGFLVFSGGSKNGRNDIPDHVVINNYYYGKDDAYVDHSCKGCH